jgi:hypothetical protein
MLISEQSFPHLQAAHDARLELELERRRVVQERFDEAAAALSVSGSQARRRPWWARSSQRMPRARAVTRATRSGAARPA